MLNHAPEPRIDASDGAEASPAPSLSKPRVCVECGDEFHPPVKGPGQHKKFCQTSCRTSFANREKARGAVLITIAQVHAAKRHAKTSEDRALQADCWAEMTRILSAFNSDDREAGRLDRLPAYVRQLVGVDNKYSDRRRR